MTTAARSLHARRRRICSMLLSALVLPAVLPGCALLSPEEKPSSAPAEPPAKKKPRPAESQGKKPSAQPKAAAAEPQLPRSLPVFLPDAAEAPRMTLDQQIRVVFSAEAAAQGAPASVPPLRAMVVLAPGSADAAFTALGMTVWRLSWDGKEITESRSPRLDERVSAEKFLRDLAFTLWPMESVRSALPAGYELRRTGGQGSETRQLLMNGAEALRAVRTESSGGSHELITLTNRAEGYTLFIESAQ